MQQTRHLCHAVKATCRLLSTTIEPPVLQELSNGVLTLKLNRGPQRHSLNRSLLECLNSTLTEVDNSNVRVVLLKSSGPVFSSGHDLKEMIKMSEQEKKDVFSLCSQTMQLLQDIGPPTLCVVEGLATAAGCQLVAACDLAVATPNATFSIPGGPRLGLACHTPAVPLVRCIGTKRAMDMLLTGRTIDASTAMEYGLISRIIDDIEVANKLAHQIATQSACATRMAKHVLYKQQSETLWKAYKIASHAMVENLKTEDATSGVESFLNKKKHPTWKHS